VPGGKIYFGARYQEAILDKPLRRQLQQKSANWLMHISERIEEREKNWN
jgi:hypothetical protein